MRIYNVEEVTIAKRYSLHKEAARQIMLIHDTLTKRFLDATYEDVQDTIIERSYVFDMEKPPSYNYSDVPEGILNYIAQPLRHESLHEFILWFLRNKQQPRDYLIKGTLVWRREKRGSGEDKTSQSTTYGGIPLELEDKHSVTVKRTFKRF